MADFLPRRILLTGGAGFVGSHFADHALARPQAILERLVVLDALTYAGNRAHLSGAERDPRFVFAHADVADRAAVERLFREHDFDAVVHLAAESHVDRSIADGVPFLRTNVLGTFTLLDVVRAAWGGGEARRFLHVSTDEVYGSLGATGHFTETSPYAPSSPYAASKAASDHFARAFFVTHGLPVIVTHAANNYGPRQLDEKLVPRAIRAVAEGRPVPMYGEGMQVREWLHVDDHVRGLWSAITRGRPGETYDLGGTVELENRETVARICDAVDDAMGRARTSRRWITRVADRPGHDFRYALDSTKARRDLGWEPQTPFEAGLAATVRSFVGPDAP